MKSFNWHNPYLSARTPIFARNIVSTSHPLAAQAGLHMLRQGGNAVDAAIATAACMTIVEPVSNGLGSDCFAIIWDGQQLHGLNASPDSRMEHRTTPQKKPLRRMNADLRSAHYAAGTPSPCQAQWRAGWLCMKSLAACRLNSY